MVACIDYDFVIRVEMDTVDKSIYEINLINTSRQLLLYVVGYSDNENAYAL